MEHTLRPTADPAWVLPDDAYDPLRESSRESRFAISNGFLGVRGGYSINRGACRGVPPRTYVAGLFDTPSPEQPIPGLVTAADWLEVRISLGSEPLMHDPSDGSSHRRTLDMKRGVLLTECRLSHASDAAARLRGLRLVSLSDRAVGQQLILLEFEAGEIEVTLEASFEGVTLELISERLDQDLGVWRTLSSGKGLAMASTSSLQIDGHDLPPTALGPFKWSWNWKSRPGQIASFERSIAVTRSDIQDLDPGRRARDGLDAARHLGWRGVVAAHETAWAGRWQCSDVEIDGDAEAQQALRFAVYHLNSAANPADERVSIAARALTGDDYRGHVFWDTEIFLLPFYTLTWPEAARTLLMYRFRTLEAARTKAAGMGWRGALYAWESADTGAETTPEHTIGPDRQVLDILCGKQEQHISADVAYAVWQYWQATADEGFFLDAGAEILLETGRFWTSRAQLEADGCYHIRGIIGPDEYHEHVDDNAFTNVMARWNIRRALDAAALLRERWPERWKDLSSRIGLDDTELKQWSNAAETMATGLDPATGLFEQFEGFFALEQIDLADYAGRSVPMDVVLGRERTSRSQVIKQADVVALLALLPSEFAGETGVDNFRYYEPRCSHGSSLSPSMHAIVAARLGYTEMALRYFRQTAAIDLADSHVAIDGGVHIAALGGEWLTAVFGFAGLSLLSDGIAVDPHLPASWRSLGFTVQWRGRSLKIRIDQTEQMVDATLEAGEPMTLVVSGKPHALYSDRVLRVSNATPNEAVSTGSLTDRIE
jgi:trehalose/maltose hydrolase-like predicted phosphorylase